LISGVDVIERATIRIETTLMRSNGTYVDLFIDLSAKEHQDSDTIILSDFGTTWGYNLDVDKPDTRSSLEYIAQNYGLQLDGRALLKSCRMDNLLPSVLSLAQACVVMSSPAFFERGQMVRPARERAIDPTAREGTQLPPALPASSTFITVLETLSHSRTSFDRDASIRLRDEYDVQVDILVRTRSRRAALMVVEHSPYEKITMRRADHAFAVHTDLKEARWKGARLSVVDEMDAYRVGQSDSLLRLGRISKLISTSDLQRQDLELAN
jgi:hypothetical protein